jgi:2-oxoglutarate dehydrogenase E2 component (dihydrolipoamide succinyltransferase)
MPQMGESITEGTIVRWIKKVGDTVARDEPLFEISTDKVDAEIPSPAAGILTEITAREGETVAVDAIVGTIGAAGEQPVAAPPAAAAPPAVPSSEVPSSALASKGPPQHKAQPQADGSPAGATNGNASSALAGRQPEREESDDPKRQKSSPLVRKIAREHNVDIGRIHGSGTGGRVTKTDILEYLQGGSEDPPLRAEVLQGGSEDPPLRAEVPAVGSGGGAVGSGGPSGPPSGSRAEPLSLMRRKIAEHMVLSRRTSAHVHTVFHVNFSTVERIRQQKKGAYEQHGAKLTYMAFIAKAVVDALRRHPIVNASLDGDSVVYHSSINLGIAVALDSGLIVPVVKNADERNMLGLSRAIADIADRARARQLKPEEVHGGTFTITNPGQFGAQFGLPIINQPQVAILGVGTIEKRPIVVDDAIAIRTMAYLALGFDHRLVDGAVADQFMADIRQQLEQFDVAQV